MNVILKDLFFGFLVIITITISEFLISLPLGNPWDYNEPQTISPHIYQSFIDKELLLTAFPTAMVIFIFLKLLNTSKKTIAIRRGLLWTIIIAINYTIIGIGNDNLNLIFSTIGFYLILISSLLSTLFYIKYYKLE